MKRIICAALAVIMVLGLVACGKTETPAPSVPTYVDGVAVENGTEIIDNVPMVKGSVVGAEKEYLTIQEVEALGYTVSYKDDQMTISKVQDIEGNLNNDVNVEDPNASTDVIGGTETDDKDNETTDNPGDVTVEDPNGSETDNKDDNPAVDNNDKDDEPVVTPPVVVEPKPEDDKPKEDTPTHTHKYTDKVVAPSCEQGGYTVHTCDCGHSYSDKETKATGHSYTEKVVAPTTSAQGYTLHTCSVCGTSYKDSYVDKLPEEKPADPKPTEPAKPGDGGYEEGGWKGDDYGSGEEVVGNATIAGQFVDINGVSRKFYTVGMNRDEAESALNGYVGRVYDERFFDDGISMNYADNGAFAKIVENNGKLGVNVFGWRKSYDSGAATNSALNMVMEAFYFFTGDREVAYALWSWIDAANINGNASSSSYGFSDVGSSSISMNGIVIEVSYNSSTKETTLYFN